MLTKWLASGRVVILATCCKSLRGVQRPADRRSPAAARAGGLLCAKILLQNFYDPNSAGGCGVAPFPSRIRFRLRSVASSLGRGCTNAKKAAWWWPYDYALAVGRSVASGDVVVFACFPSGNQWAVFGFQSGGFLCGAGELRGLATGPHAWVSVGCTHFRKLVHNIQRIG